MDRHEISRKLFRIANELIKNIESFDMTESEWETYKEKHPGADKRNHRIIPSERVDSGVPDADLINRKLEIEAKRRYFKETKKRWQIVKSCHRRPRWLRI